MNWRFLRRASVGLLFAAPTLASCVGDRAPSGLRRTPAGSGATVRFNLANQPLPDIPLPNDVATFPDPSSRTGLRLNVAQFAPTQIESAARASIDELEGWGTFMPITLSFDVDRGDPAYADFHGAALDLDNVKKRHQRDDFELADDAIYVVNLETGVPVLLDLGEGDFQYTIKNPGQYFENDPHASEWNLVFESIDETEGGKITSYDPKKDRDQDGFLDQPNLDVLDACPGPDPVCDDAANAMYNDPSCLTTRRARGRCMADHTMTFYERQTDTLIARPLLPLDEMKRYAVVVTDRLVDAKGNAVKSPFDFVYPAAQEASASRVRDIVNDPSKAGYFGDIAGTGLDHVAFTWSFTTEPTTDDLVRIRDGLYGQGPFAHLASDYPIQLEPLREVGEKAGVTSGEAVDPANWQSSPACQKVGDDLFILKLDPSKSITRALIIDAFGLGDGPGSERLLSTLDAIDHIVIGTYKTPFFIRGGQAGTDPSAQFHLDYQTGAGDVEPAVVPFMLTVPKTTATHQQPFDVAVYGHGAGGDFTEQFFYVGNLAEHGIASIAIDLVGHGRTFADDPATTIAAKGILGIGCIGPFFDALTTSRARDLDDDGVPDSGGDFWTAYLFHTRDVVRQSVIDNLVLTRMLRAFGTPNGTMICRNDETGWANPASAPCDVNGDGVPEVIGDFDGDGVPDVGGPNAKISTWGESLGGITAPIHGALDQNVSAVIPGSGAGGLTDVATRSVLGEVLEPLDSRAWGPLLVGIPATDKAACTATDDWKSDCTICPMDQVSVRWIVATVKSKAEIEIGCFDKSAVTGTTLIVQNLDNDKVACARVGDDARFRVGIPATAGDRVRLDFLEGTDIVTDYASCVVNLPPGDYGRTTIDTWGKGRFASGATNALGDETCAASSCTMFENKFVFEGDPLIAIADGYGLQRQSPDFRRFLGIAQLVLDPADPINFAPYFLEKTLNDPFGAPIPQRGFLSINTIGDMDVPLSTGIALARAAGALPFLRPDAASRYPDYADFVTPESLYEALGNTTPNQYMIDRNVLEGVPQLARHPAGASCVTSANEMPPGATYLDESGKVEQCLPPCSSDCPEETHCDATSNTCAPNGNDQTRCDQALFDADDVDEGAQQYQEQDAKIPLRLGRFAEKVHDGAVDSVWAPRLLGAPHHADDAFVPSQKVIGLLDGYVVPEGQHTFNNGEPCESFDAQTYLINLTARFFQTGGTDLYYLSHPSTHRCLAVDAFACGYNVKP